MGAELAARQDGRHGVRLRRTRGLTPAFLLIQECCRRAPRLERFVSGPGSSRFARTRARCLGSWCGAGGRLGRWPAAVRLLWAVGGSSEAQLERGEKCRRGGGPRRSCWAAAPLEAVSPGWTLLAPCGCSEVRGCLEARVAVDGPPRPGGDGGARGGCPRGLFGGGAVELVEGAIGGLPPRSSWPSWAWIGAAWLPGGARGAAAGLHALELSR
ncbi:hypothetical protein NDU88_006045 [Pleurodeles waltl]|uniref:Uncharacterized protein n=1 Tax=Pleurodeles waltl TaxID=8319 RepID=A0AAV7TWH9_PLEWA|nr:hypothetical protein NDU88_006045 [Pleurodeles waltl]